MRCGCQPKEPEEPHSAPDRSGRRSGFFLESQPIERGYHSVCAIKGSVRRKKSIECGPCQVKSWTASKSRLSHVNLGTSLFKMDLIHQLIDEENTTALSCVNVLTRCVWKTSWIEALTRIAHNDKHPTAWSHPTHSCIFWLGPVCIRAQ